jgi:hypothetical protein
MIIHDRLGSNSSHSHHGQTSIQQLVHLILLQRGLILGRQPLPSKVTGLPLPLHSRLNTRVRNDNIPKRDPKQKLMHRSLQKSIVSSHRLGHGLEGVSVSGDTDKVLDDEAGHGKHGGAAVADFGFAEEGDEGGVSFGETEGVELEGVSFEVYSS